LKRKFTVELTHRFSKQIRALDQKAQVQIIKEVYSWENGPKVGKPLHGEFKGVFSTRIGNYRILYQISSGKILVLAVSHRKNVYKR
jgi:mRNA-degrading endonuclease RelE of RelBE toxin-antitoxin system